MTLTYGTCMGGGAAQGDQSKLPIVRVQRVPIRALLKQNKRNM